jgi:hypothetical protein
MRLLMNASASQDCAMYDRPLGRSRAELLTIFRSRAVSGISGEATASRKRDHIASTADATPSTPLPPAFPEPPPVPPDPPVPKMPTVFDTVFVSAGALPT